MARIEASSAERVHGAVSRSVSSALIFHKDRVIRDPEGVETLTLDLPASLLTEGKLPYQPDKVLKSLNSSDITVRIERNILSSLSPKTTISLEAISAGAEEQAWSLTLELDEISHEDSFQDESPEAESISLVIPRILEYSQHLFQLRELMEKAGIPESDFGIPQRALALAEIHHRGVRRADGVQPYITHPLAVAEILMKEFGIRSPEDIAVSLIHDVPEDSPTWRQEKATGQQKAKEVYTEWRLRIERLIAAWFSPVSGEEAAQRIASNTMALSRPEVDNDTILSPRISEYFYRKYISPFRIRIIKMADRLHNLRTLPAVSRRRQMDTLISTYDESFPLFSRGLYEPGNEGLTLYALRQMWKEVSSSGLENDLDFETPYWADPEFGVDDFQPGTTYSPYERV